MSRQLQILFWALVLGCFFELKTEAVESQRFVPIDNPIYGWLDSLSTEGYAPGYIMGIRPISIREVQHYEQLMPEAHPLKYKINRELQRLLPLEESRPHFYLEGFRRNRLRFLSSNSARLIPTNRGAGGIDAIVDPLAQEDLYSSLRSGVQLSGSTEIIAELGPHLLLFAEPLIRSKWEESEAADDRFIANQLYAQLSFFGMFLKAGRFRFGLGQKEIGGVIFSPQAGNFDGLQIGNTMPLQFFSSPIYTKLNFSWGNLGTMPTRSKPYFFGGEGSFLFTKHFEAGIHTALIYGGEGAPPIEWHEVFLESFSYNKTNNGTGDPRVNIANNIVGGDIRVRLPASVGTSLYFDSVFDDRRKGMFDNFENMMDFFEDQVGYSAGLVQPHFGSYRRLHLRLQYTKMPPLLFKHYLWTSGYSRNFRPLGEPLGSDAREYLVKFKYDLPELKSELGVQTAFLRRRAHSYSQGTLKEGGIRRVFITQRQPQEESLRLQIDWLYELDRNLELKADLGFENIWNYQFTKDRGHNTYRTALELRYYGF